MEARARARRSPRRESRSRRSTSAPSASRRSSARYFEREVFPILTPLAVGPGQPFPYVSGLSLSLGVIASDPETGEERFARVKVPEVLDRFVTVGKRLVPLESVISHFLPMLFPGMEIAERALFRVTRDADFELSDDADDLLEAVESELRRRRFGDVVRLEVSRSASRDMRERLIEGLDVRPGQVYEIEGLLDQSELWQLVALDRPDLKHEPWVPVVPPRWARVTSARRRVRGDPARRPPRPAALRLVPRRASRRSRRRRRATRT